jgi:hypothetical protein
MPVMVAANHMLAVNRAQAVTVLCSVGILKTLILKTVAGIIFLSVGHRP